MRLARALGAVLLLGLAAPVFAQSVGGRVLDASTGRPVQGAVLVLLDPAGSARAGGLSNPRGEFVLGPAREGRYRSAVDGSARPDPSRKEPVGTSAAVAPDAARDRGGNCPVLLYVDGVPFEPLSTGTISAEIPPSTIEAVEVYSRASAVPGEFRGPGFECGVIVVWKR